MAFIKDYDNEWDGEQDQWHGPLDRFSDDGWFAAAQRTHTPMDFLYLRNSVARRTTLQDLAVYDLLVYPHATILTEETANLLKEYVAHGGTFIMGARTGYKDRYGRCPMRPMPGFASELCGVRVVDYTHLSPGDDAEYAVWDGEEVEAPVFNDILEPMGAAQSLATFKGNYYDGACALVANPVGKGTAYYFGAGFSTKTAEAFLRKLGFAEPHKDLVGLPAEAELAIRTKDGTGYLFILNYVSHPLRMDVRKPMTDLLTGRMVSGVTELEKYGVMVLALTL